MVLLPSNGGEFVNKSLIQLSHQFGIPLNTTAAHSPWSNGTIECHNLVLAEMVEKIADTKCHFEVGLAWAINAKNSCKCPLLFTIPAGDGTKSSLTI